MRHSISTLIILCLMTISINSHAQRRINPVETPSTQTKAVNHNPKDTTKTPDPKDMPNLIHFHDEKGNVVYVDTVTGKEIIDSTDIKKDSKMTYPLCDEVTIGLNVWDPVMRCLGEDYGLFDVWAELSIHNRFKPIIELGIGQASHKPDAGNYKYISAVAPYFKVGMNYNFLFKKTKEYQFYAGLRYGITPFSYEISAFNVDNSYWNEHYTSSVPRQKATVGYGEVVMGLKVQIHKQWSLGWAFKYHLLLHESKNSYGAPWYIPGFGTRNSVLAGAFNVMYTIPLGKKKSQQIAPTDNLPPSTTQPIDNK